MLLQGFEGVIQIDGKVYNLKTNSVLAGENQGSALFYTKNRSTNGPILVEASVQNSVIFYHFSKKF